MLPIDSVSIAMKIKVCLLNKINKFIFVNELSLFAMN